MTRVALIGAGHAHLELLADSARFAAAGIRLLLIDPGRFWYGGRIASLMAGRVAPEALRVSLRRLCREAGAELASDRAIGLDTRHRRVWTATGAVHAYDAVSINVGCEADLSGFEDGGSRVRVWPADSVAALAQLRAELDDSRGRGRAPRIAIAGGGRRAVEIAAGLSVCTDTICDVALYVGGPRLLPEAPASVGRRAAHELARRGVDLVFDTRLAALGEGAATSADGRAFAAEHLVVADRSRGARFVHAGGLPVEADRLYVTRRLYTPGDERVFAVGPCAQTLAGHVLAADTAERQAATVSHNLRAALTRRPYRDYKPADAAGIVDLGDGRGIIWRGRFWWHGAWAVRRKARIDARQAARVAPADVIAQDKRSRGRR